MTQERSYTVEFLDGTRRVMRCKAPEDVSEQCPILEKPPGFEGHEDEFYVDMQTWKLVRASR